VFLITFNEADRIGRTLAALNGWCEQVVVVDSGSTDGTPDLARAAGAEVFHNAWPGYGPQKRFAEDRCRHVWMLNLDADEVAPPALAREVRAAVDAPAGPAAYRLRIADVLPGEDRPGRFAYTVNHVRLYRADAGRYANSLTFDRVDLAPGTAVGQLHAPAHHHSIRSLSHLTDKLNSYTDKQIAEMATRSKTLPAWRLVTEWPFAFLKGYFARGLFLRGGVGLSVAGIYAFSRWLRVAKSREAARLSSKR
jgi:glycosyltransferase involved in cell wall biosynthesis